MTFRPQNRYVSLLQLSLLCDDFTTSCDDFGLTNDDCHLERPRPRFLDLADARTSQRVASFQPHAAAAATQVRLDVARLAASLWRFYSKRNRHAVCVFVEA